MGTALIVEDHPDQAEMVARLLRLYDYVPIVAETGESGLEMARRLDPDVVLLDLMLPDINGFDVCRRLRSDRATMLTPVVMLTALGGSENRLRGFRVGANAYLTKPYGMQELFDAIKAARAWRADLELEKMQGEIHVELNSEITLLQDLNDFLMSLCKSTPLDNDQVMQLRQAVMEIAQNAIEWGNRHQSDRLVNIIYRIFDERIEIEVRDQGSGFDLNNLPHAAIPDDPFSHLDVRDKLGLRAGGFGLMICKGMVDELRYNDAGNEVTLIKQFNPRDPD
ncbi:Histidine kinase-like ATPase domain-containing protein [Singulisphaera sp. GP187]|uniref:response regulator n=1 Tax=Singulisphaera sp. GP187 TaxID=1882752 RepID=UPI0009283785|nr:response regulator [Singulisphaera sp. GP187]SIO16105.1 Histidine kinase-like ATPase domain-containing protein [Singulisphaera sp. GP187]